MTGFWPAISARSAAALSTFLRSFDGLADTHVEHDLVDARHLHGVLVAELLGQLVARRPSRSASSCAACNPSDAASEPCRLAPCAAASCRPLARLPSAAFRRRPSRRAFSACPWPASRPCRLSALRRLLGLASLARLFVFSHGSLFSGMTSPERFAKRTLRPSSSILKPTRVGLPSLGSSSARLERWIGASFAMMPPSWAASASGAGAPC